MIITIDGPTGSGKSSAARGLAERLNFYCMSSGSLYRALAYVLLNHFGYDKEQLANPNINDIKEALDSKIFTYSLDKKSCGSVSFNGVIVSMQALKSDEASQGASIIATNKFAREQLSNLQRELAKSKDFILEGRDSGSVVFENADIKFYLTAQLGERAQRWQKVQQKRGEQISFEQAKKHIKERDTRDQEREISPLIIPKDSVVIDNTDFNADETIETMLRFINKAA